MTSDGKRFRTYLQAELDNAHLYETLAAIEKNPQLAEVYRRMAASEGRHAAHWSRKLTDLKDLSVPKGPSWRSRTLAKLAWRFGSGLVLPLLAEAEAADRGTYSTEPAAAGTGLSQDENAHRRSLKVLLSGMPGGVEGGTLAQIEGRHRSVGGNALRAGVLGANDGLVSNLSLVMGVAGAEVSGQGILITGLAGLMAGAISMALGEWLSVQSSRELTAKQIDVERAELTEHPEEEAQELALIYEAKGLPKEQAEQLARGIITNEATALETLAREELGLDPSELGGSAWTAAGVSFALFAVGAVIPVFPFFFLEGSQAVLWSLGVSAVGLFGIGALITLMTGRGVLFSGLRQMGFGLGAAAITFAIGRLVGVQIGG
jgi:VIT1/CCC1 family predicted Fe2+/Mn2+ transporter